MSDLRLYCTEEYKRLVKLEAVNRGMSITELLLTIVQKEIPDKETTDKKASIQAEIDQINFIMQRDGQTLSSEQKTEYRNRREALKKDLQNC